LYRKLLNCKYCGLDFTILNKSEAANHSRWCRFNPKYDEYKQKAIDHAKNISPTLSKESIEKRSKGIKEAYNRGCYLNMKRNHFSGKHHTKETKDHLREKALNSDHRRLVKSCRNYIRKDGTVIILDSSWEELLAKRLDELNIFWIRPKTPIKWIDSKNIKHNYFPDFYLPTQNLYLDPKNEYAYKSQLEKIKWLLKNIHNLIILTSIEECSTFILP